MASPAYGQIIHFVRIDVAGRDPLRVSNGTGSPYPLDTKFGRYTPIGQALGIEGLGHGDSLSARDFRITLGATNDRLVRFIRRTNIKDAEVCIHEARALPVESKPDASVVWGEPELVMLGRLGEVSMAERGVTAECYTVASDLDAPYTVNRCDDILHRKFRKRPFWDVKGDDYIFFYATGPFEGVITT